MFLDAVGSRALAVHRDGGTGDSSPCDRRLVEAELLARLPLYRRLAAQRLRSLVDAEEVVQAVAQKALERAGQLREPLAVRGWLRRIFETTLVDHCRRAGGRKAREVPFDVTLHDRAEDHEPQRGPTSDAVAAVVKQLPHLKAEYAIIIEQVDLKERPRSDVALDLGVTVNNLTVRLHRARGALRSQLAGDPSWLAAVA